MRPEDDAVVAELVLKRRWVDKAGLQRALEIQQAAAAIELDERLLHILVTKGFLSERQARELEDEVGLGRLVEPDRCQAIRGYRILAKLGQGGMGAVFKAMQLSISRLVALKVLAPELAAEPSFVQRFLREARTVGSVNHPNLVCGLDSGRSKEFHYYAMEYVEGQNLYDALADGPLPISRVLDVAAQMAQALGHLHRLALVHRDIKPSNILVTPEGTAKLCDLGLARSPGDPSVTDTGVPIGTPHYTSPELASGSTHADIRSDIYSLGATLYHLVTGQYPFKAASSTSLLEKHLGETLQPPLELRPDMPPALSDLICRMMAKDPRERVQTPDELLHAIEGVSAGPEESQSPALPSIAPPQATPAAEPLPAIAPPAEAGPAAQPAPPAEVPEMPVRRPWRRGLSTAAWAATYAVLVALLSAAIVWAVRARQRHVVGADEGATEPREQAPGTDMWGPATDASPVAVAPPQEDVGRRVAEAALAYDREHPSDHRRALLELRRGLLAVSDPSLTQELEARLAARRRTRDEGAGQAFAQLQARLKTLRDGDRFGEALGACAAFPQEFSDGVWAERIDAQMATLAAQAERRYLELGMTGLLLLRQHRLDEAVQSYEKIAALGIPWIREQGDRLTVAARAYAGGELRRIEEAARQRAADERRRSFGRLTRLFEAVHDELKRRQYGKARELCRAPEVPREGELGAAVTQLEREIGVLIELWDALRQNAPALRGRPIRLFGLEGEVVGVEGAEDNPQLTIRLGVGAAVRIHRQPLDRLPAPQLAQLAGWALERDTAAGRGLKLGVFFLAEGKAAEARHELELAKAAGADAEPYMRELDAELAVAGALEAQADQQWDKARQLLEAVFGPYATTSAAVLHNGRLVAAMARVLTQLGQPPPGGPLQPSPTPLGLRRFVLLPETLFPADPPPGLLGAYMDYPLHRRSPALVGLDTWDDYTVTLDWTPGQGNHFIILLRLTEPRPGQFDYYYLDVDARRLLLGRMLQQGVKELASCPCRTLWTRRRHRLVVSVQGSELLADADGTYRLRASDGGLVRGNLGLATADARLLVHELSVVLRARE